MRALVPPVSSAPPVLRDPWAWASAAGALPLLAKCIGAPLGEPVAEDFDFLHRALFHGMGTLLDGGGSQMFWRPLAHQVYYAVMGRMVLAHPTTVGLIHAACLALGAWLLYRVFRIGMEGPVAAVAATFPLLAESTRTIVGWPTQFVDCGLFLFSSLALYETSRRRLPTALAALLAALLCKELAVVTAALMPLLPGPRSRRERRREALAVGALVLAWGATYLAVRHAAHLELPHGLERGTAGLLAPFAWALAASLRAVASLAIARGPMDVPALAGALLLLAAAMLAWAFSGAVRARLAARRAWMAWGLAWFAAATVSLTPIYPVWQPNRSQIGSVGLGAALAPALAEAHPALAGGLVVLRLGLLALAPGAERRTSGDPPATGAFMDFARLTRLQHYMRITRTLLREKYPHLPAHSYVVLENMPHVLLYAFGGDRAVQVWTGDTTLRTVTINTFQSNRALPVGCVLEYQPWASTELVDLDLQALIALEDGYALLLRRQFDAALASLARADSLERDPRKVVFRAATVGLVAFAYATSGRYDEARRQANRALVIYPHNRNARIVLAADAERMGRLEEAEAQLDTIQADDPSDAKAAAMRGEIAAMRGLPPATGRAPTEQPSTEPDGRRPPP